MGMIGIIGSKGAVRHAFNKGLIEDGQVWMNIIKDRNLAAHSYDEETAQDLVIAIIDEAFSKLQFLKKQP